MNGNDGNNPSTRPSITSFTSLSPNPATSTTCLIVVDGDSTTEGAGVVSPWPDSLTVPNGQQCLVYSVAVDGKGLGTPRPAGGVDGNGNAGTLETMISTGTSVIDHLCVSGLTNIIVLGPTVNDIANGTSASDEYRYLTTYVANRHAASGCNWKVVVTPALSNASHDSVMQTYDGSVAGNMAGADAVVVLPQSLVGNGAYSNATFFQDGVHPTQLSHKTIIAPAESAAIRSLF
jgi:hypothetical protein